MDPAPAQAFDPAYTDSAVIMLKNSLPIAITSVTLTHQYSTDPVEQQTWPTIPAGGISPTGFTVHFNTGFIRYGMDYWTLAATLEDGTSLALAATKECMLRPDDSGKTITFELLGDLLDLNLPSGGCPANLAFSSPLFSETYNTMTGIKIQNGFPVPLVPKLTHRYSSDTAISHAWDVVPAGQTTAVVFPVYYLTGILHPGSDHWDVELDLQVVPPDNAPQQVAVPWKNATIGKMCMLKGADAGQVLTFVVAPSYLQLAMPSGGCMDSWTTPDGHNTGAFIAIQNGFDTTIRKVTLTHQYSSDQPMSFTRALIPPATSSADPIAVEYNTGDFHPGMDYWNVELVLEDGRAFRNSKKDKECYLEVKDSTSVLTYAVSASTFNINLPSGGCKDGMTALPNVTFGLGIDTTLPYDENAYLASHNAFANFAEWFVYANQAPSIPDQLAYGVTCLLLDIWDYRDDVYLIHKNQWLQPFGKVRTLVDGLNQIASFLNAAPNPPVLTIVFEDKVTLNRSKILKAFVTTGLASKVFYADRPNKGSQGSWNPVIQGWPTLDWMTSNGFQLVVFSSVAKPFPYQWAYMTENVYSDESLDPKVWVDPRSESQDLNKLPLCAINHFPSFQGSGLPISTWLDKVKAANTVALLNQHVDACNKRWSVWPNYLNVDFVDLPSGEPAAAMVGLNAKRHVKAPAPLFMGFEQVGDGVLAAAPGR